MVEEDYKPLSMPEMTVWDDKHPKPPPGDDFEHRGLLKRISAASDKQLAALVPSDEKSLAQFRESSAAAVDVVVTRQLRLQGSARSPASTRPRSR